MMLPPQSFLPAVGVILMVVAGVATYNTPFFWLWLIEAIGMVALGFYYPVLFWRWFKQRGM